MFPTRKQAIPRFGARYANQAFFCDLLERELKPLYLLAYLLTANHRDAEQCFIRTVDESFQGQIVFKDWAQSWVKRCLIKHAIRIVSPAAGRSVEKEIWSPAQRQSGHNFNVEVEVVTRLAPLERFVYVMMILERYSAWDCSLLLGCSIKKVARAQMRALRQLPEVGESFSVHDAPEPWSMQVTA